jgi:tetratricopeptide (TPR) repeat protein
MSVEEELVRWMLLIAAAIALMLALATALAADPTRPPGLLPQPIGELAKPILPAPMRPFFPENPPPGRILPPAEAAARLWMIFDSHRAGCAAEALAGWNEVRLPDYMAHWREMAIGAAYMQAGDLPRAEMSFEGARQMQPDHAILAYFTGLLRLEQATAAMRVPDNLNKNRDSLVSYTPGEDKAMYEAAAIAELQFAIARAHEIRLDEPLIETDMQIEESVFVPRTGNLLVALGADNFVGKAHHTLFGVMLKRGELDAADYHLGQAARRGIAVLYGYRDLAEAYVIQERNSDALRALRRDLEIQFPWAARLFGLEAEVPMGDWVW